MSFNTEEINCYDIMWNRAPINVLCGDGKSLEKYLVFAEWQVGKNAKNSYKILAGNQIVHS